MNSRWSESDLEDYQAKRGLKIEIVSVEPKKKESKFKNQRTVVDNIEFASKREATRYQDLKAMLHAGLISGLTLQPRYPLIVNDIKVAHYVGDFQYFENGAKIVEDVKAPYLRKNMYYRLKKKLVRAIYGIEIRET